MRIGAIIQARMGSKRLPGKVMLKLGTKPALQHVIERTCHGIELQGFPIVATTTLKEDNCIETLCAKLNVACFRGDVHNVLNRYYETAKFYKLDLIIRITGDCPFIQKILIKRVIVPFQDGWENSSLDYVSNIIVRTFPKGWDVEAFTFKCLERLHQLAKTKKEKEHVTLYLLKHLTKFNVVSVIQLNDKSYLRFVLDTPEDYELLKKGFKKGGPNA